MEKSCPCSEGYPLNQARARNTTFHPFLYKYERTVYARKSVVVGLRKGGGGRVTLGDGTLALKAAQL